jgi:hypothetical protein
MRILIVCAITFAVGFVAGQLRGLLPGAVEAAAPPSMPVERAPAPPECLEVAELRARQRNNRGGERYERLEALRAERGEVRAPWPDDDLSEVLPGALRFSLEQGLESHEGARLHWTDCGEFPCIAVLSGPDARAVADVKPYDQPVRVEERDGWVIVYAPADAQTPRMPSRVEAMLSVLTEIDGPPAP